MTLNPEIFYLLLFNAIVIFGFSKATDFDYVDDERPELGLVEGSKMVFWRFRVWSLETFGSFWSKAICTCVICMASIHSVYVYWLFMPWTLESLIMYPFYILALAGFNSFAAKI